MRKVIAALQTTVDGFIEGPKGEMDWVVEGNDEVWKDVFEMLESADTCVLGRLMYPSYEQYWLAVLDSLKGNLPLSGEPASKNEIAYAQWADRTPHVVLSRTLDKVAWKTTRIVREIGEIRKIKQQPGKNIFAVGGAAFVSSLINTGLVDQLRLTINPLLLGGGKALFKDVKGRHPLKLASVKALNSGKVSLIYNV